MRKMFSKLLALTLVLVMSVSLLAACGGSSSETKSNTSNTDTTGTADTKQNTGDDSTKNTGDMVTVKIALVSVYDMTDAPMVQEAINKVLAEKYGIQCELIFINMGSWQQQTNLLLTGSEVDVMTYFMLPLNTYVSNGQCLALDDYVANASDTFKAIWTDAQMAGCQVGGVQYSIPNLRNFGNDMCFFVDTEKFAAMGYTASDITSLEDVDKFLYEAKEAYSDLNYILVPQNNSKMVNGWSWDGLGDQNWVGVLGNCGHNTEVTNIFDDEGFQELCGYTHKWYTDGLIMGDALSNQENSTSLIKNGSALCAFGNASNAETEGLTKCIIVENWTEANNISALSFGINPLSAHQDEAWTLLESLYVDDELATLLINGIEDVHYIMNEDGSCSYPEGVDALTSTYGNATAYWAMPYAANVPPITDLGGGATFFSDLKKFNDESNLSGAMGFVFDSSEVVDEYSACLNIIQKYYEGLLCGVLDPEEVISVAVQELEDAGMNKIIDAKQEQLDALLSSK